MNLTADLWIPVIDSSGGNRLVSLDTLYRDADNIHDLGATPPQRISLMRLLICITQAALDGPEDEQDWLRSRGRIVPASREYLAKWRDRYELYGDKPFLQVPDLVPIHNATVDKLDFGLAAGHKAVLFDHGAAPQGRTQSHPWRALMLLTYQCFSPGGRIGTTEWDGFPTTGAGTSEHAPGVEGSALHTLIRCSSLLATLHANLLTRKTVAGMPNSSWGQPVWERPPTSPRAASVEALVHSYLGRLVPLSRAIRLEQDSAVFSLANGLSYPKLPAGRDPTTTIVKRGKGIKEKLVHLPVSLAKHPWRELAAVLSLANGPVAGGSRALGHLAHLPDEVVDIWTGGLAADRGKILDVAEWAFAFDIGLMEEPCLAVYEKGVALSVAAEGVLYGAVRTYSSMLSRENTPAAAAKSHFWSTLDTQYGNLIRVACSDTLGLDDGWRQTVEKAMREAYAFACPHTTPRQIQAYAHGLRFLRLKNKDK